jgi:hypothetical protein
VLDDDDEPDVPGEEDPADEEVRAATTAFLLMVRLAPPDGALACLAVEAVVRAVADARGPDDPVPGMMTVPTLVADPLARARLADAAPSSAEVLGDLERALVRLGPREAAAAAERIRAAVRAADDRLAPGTGP